MISAVGALLPLLPIAMIIKKSWRVRTLSQNGPQADSLVSEGTIGDAEHPGDNEEEAVHGMVSTTCYWQCALMWHCMKLLSSLSNV